MLIQKVVQALTEHKVRYAVVGGFAVALHGAVRGTVDVDIVVTLNKKAFRQTEKALRSIGLEPRLPVTADEVFDFRQEYIDNRNLKAWSFVNPDIPTEMVDVLITDDASEFKTVTKSVAGKKVKIACVTDLIAMKLRSGRPQDLEDIKALEKLS